MSVLPRLLAGLRAWAQPYGPCLGSVEPCVAPTHAPLSHREPSPRHRANKAQGNAMSFGENTCTVEGKQGWMRPGCSTLTAHRFGRREGRQMSMKTERLSKRKSDHKAPSQPSKNVTQTDGLYIRSIKRCQSTPLAREHWEKP